MAAVLLLAVIATAAVDASVKESLILLYQSTKGTEWLNNSRWNTDSNVCEWFGVVCSGKDVVSLKLANNNLEGTLPEMNLISVSSIDLSLNRVSGTLPCSIFSENLFSLSIPSNSFVGSIPECISQARQLSVIEFDSNSFVGQIPNSITTLQNLHTLSISWDKLTGTLPSLMGNMTNLQYVYLGSNQISGSLPDLSPLRMLRNLWLDNNLISGSLPTSLTKVVGLSELILRDNKFKGSIPEFHLSQLQKCDLGSGYTCPLRSQYCPVGCACIASCERSCEFGQACSLDILEPIFISATLVVVSILGLLYRRFIAVDLEKSTHTVANTPSQNQLPDRLKPGRWRVDVEKWTVDVQIVKKEDHRKSDTDIDK